MAQARALFEPLGRVMDLDEKHMDAVTGLSASGPAFMFVILESLAEGGVQCGLPRKVALEDGRIRSVAARGIERPTQVAAGLG